MQWAGNSRLAQLIMSHALPLHAAMLGVASVLKLGHSTFYDAGHSLLRRPGLYLLCACIQEGHKHMKLHAAM